MLNKKPMITASGPVIWRLNSTAGTPISMVFGCASPRASPTGTKSHPTCTLYAKSAGRAKDGSMAPRPIWSPISTPITCAITAPGPSTGERNGSPTMTESTRSPIRLDASGESVLAIRFPSPDALMSPIRSVTNAMNGRTFLMTVSMACRPLWNRMPTTPPMLLPNRAIKPVKPPPIWASSCAVAAPTAAAGRPAAVYDDGGDLTLRRRRAEPIHGLGARHLGQPLGQVRDAAAGDGHYLVLLRRRLDDERPAPPLGSPLHLDGPELSSLHDRPPKARRPGGGPGTGLCTA